MMHELPQEHDNPEDEDELDEEIWFTVPEKMVGYAIGKGGQTKNRIMEQTNTYIKTKRIEDDETYFVVRGTRENQYSAKLFIKQTVNTGILRNRGLGTLRFPVIDSSSGEFELKLEKKDGRRTKKRSFELVLKSSSGEMVGNTDYSFLSDQITQILRQNKETNRASKIWCHFGHIYLTNIKPEEEGNVYTPDDLKNHLMPRRFCPPDIPEVTKWQAKFFGYIKNQDEETFFSQLERWMSSQSKTSPFLAFHRYEFTYLTPSCIEIRIKVFVEVKQLSSDPSNLAFENAPSPVDVKNVLKHSDTYPYFYICESTAKRAVVDILEPSGPDIRLITEANLTSGPEDEELRDEVEILYEYVRENLVITQDGKVNLIQHNVPEDFDLHYSRMSERKIYTVTSEDDEKFDVIICYESPRDIKKGDYDDTKNSVDIHLFYHEWENKFKSNSWDPQEVVEKIPRFMACARSLARALMVDDTTPPEILARGPKARRAYQMALKSGKTKNLRVPVMLVGQSCAGKTSLLRSLKREKFDPKEDSTEGVKLHRSISKAEEEVWREEETTENSFHECAAKAMAENLTAPTSGQELSTLEDDDENLSLLAIEESLHQSVDVPTEEKRKSRDFSDGTEEQSKENPIQSRAFELKSQEEQETTPENVSENAMPEEVVEKAAYMLQNLKTMENNESIQFITMDFAGQPVYQTTHPVFLSPKGIYVLVHSLKNDAHELAIPIVRCGSSEPRKIDDNCPMTNMDHLEFWLSFVASNATTIEDNPKKEPQAQGLKPPKKFPPVFLVCTHADEPFEKQNSEDISQRILAHLKREENPSGQHLVHAIYPIDNTVSGSTDKEENMFVKKLREDIRIAAKRLPQMAEDIPIRWLKFEKELTEIEHKKYITFEEAKNIAVKCQVNLESDEVDTLLTYLHDLKVIIYFEDTNMIIIDTQWLLEMFVKVITVQPFLEWEPECKACWEKLENEGILERLLVEHLWSDVADEQNTIDVLLTVMEKFSLLCRWKRLDGSEVFLVPAMLVNSVAESFNKLLTGPQLPIPLVIRFTRAHLPLGIFPRMLVAIAEFCNKKWPKSRLPKFFHNFCRFYDVGGENGLLDSSLDLVVTSDMRTITVGVIPSTNNDVSHDWDLIVKFCQLIKEFINDTLNDMRKNYPWMKTMGSEFGICCPICSTSPNPCRSHKTNGCMRDTCTHFIPKEELPRCYSDPTNRNTVINKESYSHWFPKAAKNLPRVETVGLESAPSGPSDLCSSEPLNRHSNRPLNSVAAEAASCKDLEVCFGDKSIATIDKNEAASKVADLLKLNKLSLEDPPDDIVVKCRQLCFYLKSNGREDIVKQIRDVLPSGMTGPLGDGSLLVKYMDYNSKQRISRALSGEDEYIWKEFAQNVGVSEVDIKYYGQREKNPVLIILDEHCGDMTVGELYVHIVKCGANATADNHL